MSEVFKELKKKDIDLKEISNEIMKDKALDSETKRLMAISCAAALDCEFCINHHKEIAQKKGIDPEKIKEAILVAALVGFGSKAKNINQVQNK